MTLLPQVIGVVRVTGLSYSQEKFTMGNIQGYL